MSSKALQIFQGLTTYNRHVDIWGDEVAKIIKLKRKNKPYAVRWKVGDKDSQEAFDTRAQAELFRSQKNVELSREGRRVRRKRGQIPTFEVVARAYLAIKKMPRRGDALEPITLRVYTSYLEDYVIPNVGDIPVNRVSETHFEAVFDKCEQLGLARKTKKEALRLMSAVLKHAKACGYINEVPTHGIDTTPTKSEKRHARLKQREKTYTPDEVFTMLAAADSLANDDNKQIKRVWARYRAMLYFLVYTGVRIGEARGFPRKDFRLREGIVQITQSAPETGKSGDVKTDAGDRDIPMHPRLREVLEDWLKTHKRSLAFGTDNDLPISVSNLYSRMLEPLKVRGDLLADGELHPRYVKISRDRAFHAFRHHYASQLVKNGANLKELQVLMGHASAAITLDVYTHLFEGDQVGLVTTIDI